MAGLNVNISVLTLTLQLITAVAAFDTAISNANLEPQNCITRLDSDLRFAKDKTLYKNDGYIILNNNGKNGPSAFYDFHIDPGSSFISVGLWNPKPDLLKKFCQQIDYAFDEWTATINDKAFRKNFFKGVKSVGVSAKVVKGFEANNPASERVF